MHSLRTRILGLWGLSLVACIAVGFLLVQLYQQSTEAQVGRAEAVVARACDLIRNRYGFYAAGWSGPEPGRLDNKLRSDLRLSADAASRLLAHPWPGNVRELLNAMKRASTLVRRPIIAAEDLAFLVAPGHGPAEPVGATDWLAGTLPEVVARVEMALIRRALSACGGNRAQAAERLGIRRQLLYQKLERYGLGVSQNGTADVAEEDTSSAPP